MSRSYRKTPIFGNAGGSDKKDKRINNRMFRNKENSTSKKIEIDDEDLFICDSYPMNMNEVRSLWSMKKDGKHWWLNATKKDMSK